MLKSCSCILLLLFFSLLTKINFMPSYNGVSKLKGSVIFCIELFNVGCIMFNTHRKYDSNIMSSKCLYTNENTFEYQITIV